MTVHANEGSELRFAAYVEELVAVIGHAVRAAPLKAYCIGLVLPSERKSVEPLAAMTAPARVAAQHQSLLHFVGNSPWSDDAMLDKVRELARRRSSGTGRSMPGSSTTPAFRRRGGIRWA